MAFGSTQPVTEMSKVKVKWFSFRPGVTQRVGRDIALLLHDRGIRRGWVVSSTPRPHFTTGKDPVPIVQEAGWAPGPVWTDGKSRPHRIRSWTHQSVVSRYTEWATRPTTEMSTSDICWGVKVAFMWLLSRNLGSSTSCNPQGLYRDCFILPCTPICVTYRVLII